LIDRKPAGVVPRQASFLKPTGTDEPIHLKEKCYER
jgi:hypothetical protein